MIEQPLPYEEENIKLILSSKRYLLESIIEGELEEADFPYLLKQIRGRRLTQRQRNITTILKTHHPAEIIEFKGMRMFKTTEWWLALVKMVPTVPDPARAHIEPIFMVRGWNNIHGIQAELPEVGDLETLKSKFDSQVEKKVDKGYKEDLHLKNVTLGTGVSTLPPLPGLPPPEPSPVFTSTEELETFTAAAEPKMVRPSPPKSTSTSKTKTKRKSMKKVASETEQETTSSTPPSPTTLTDDEEARKAMFREKMKARKKKSEW